MTGYLIDDGVEKGMRTAKTTTLDLLSMSTFVVFRKMNRIEVSAMPMVKVPKTQARTMTARAHPSAGSPS